MTRMRLPDGAEAGMLFAVAVLLGLEAATLRRWKLLRSKWTDHGIVVSDDVETAERRFFDRWFSRGASACVIRAADSTALSTLRARGASTSLTASSARSPSRRRAVSVAIVDYGSGNLHSAAKAFERAARDSSHTGEIVVTSDPDVVRRADRIVLPGVGAFADCRHGLDAVTGMVDALEETVRKKGRPFLGICVGMQLMAERGREYVVDAGTWLDRRRSRPHRTAGYLAENSAHGLEHAERACVHHPLLDNIKTGPDGLHAYFVHSYHLNVANRSDLVADADYGGAVTAIVARDTVVGTQFHPEKSQRLGLALIANFLKWKP